MSERLDGRAEGSARPEGRAAKRNRPVDGFSRERAEPRTREAPALGGGSGAARCGAPGGTTNLGSQFSSIWFGVLTTLTFAWVLLCFAALPSKRYGTKFEEFLALDLNAMGDVIAGVSASLAFLWLIVTAFMQRSELEAQREQLAATAIETQRMADAQVQQHAVMSAQTRLLSEQTGIFVAQMADANCDAILKGMISFFEEGPVQIYFGEYPDALTIYLHRKLKPEFEDDDRFLAEVMASLTRAFQRRVSSELEQDFEENTVIEPFGDMLELVEFQVPRVSDGMKVRLARLKVLQCASAYKKAYFTEHSQ